MATAFLYLKDFIVKNNWHKTDSIVTNFDISNSSSVWTELEYQYEEQDYKTKIEGHSYYMRRGSKVEIYVNPNNPENIKVANNLYGVPKVLLRVAAIFIFIILVFVVPVYIEKKRINK